MVLLILLVLALFVVQTLLPAGIRYLSGPDVGGKLMLALGSRDQQPPQRQAGERAHRALENMYEALPVFLTLALLNLFMGTGDLALTGATVFLVARVLYVLAYLAGIFLLRSIIWVVGIVGLVLMLVPILARI